MARSTGLRIVLIAVALATCVGALRLLAQTSSPGQATKGTSDAPEAPGTAAQPAPRVRLRYGGDMDFAPYEWLDEHGVPHGFQVDLIRALAQRMNMDVEVRLGPWHEIFSDFLAGEIDVVSMAEQPERYDAAEFCAPHLALVSEIFVREGSPELATLADLANKEVIVQQDALSAHVLSRQLPSVRLVPVITQSDALRVLASGQHDAAIAVQANGRHIIHRYHLTNVRSTGPTVLMSNYAFATRKGDTALRNQLNDALNALKQEEQYGSLFNRWFPAEASDANLRRILKWISVLAIPVAGLLVLWAIWTRTLRSKVSKQTAELREQLDAKARAESEVRLLLNELDHRVRNLLASIVALAELQPAKEGSVVQFRSDFLGRVRAMAAAHNALRGENALGFTFDNALRTLAAQFGSTIYDQIHREGPDLTMPPQKATALCMVLHEMLSNSTRYGALAKPDGSITILTSEDSDGATIRWFEHCTDHFASELKSGFGFTLMHGMIVHQLHGRLDLHMGPHGLDASFFIPSLHTHPSAPATVNGAIA